MTMTMTEKKLSFLKIFPKHSSMKHTRFFWLGKTFIGQRSFPVILTHTSSYKRQEESSEENKNYSVNLNSASMNDRKSSSDRFCATYFLHENEGDSGHFENWLRSDVTDFQLNAYEPTNHGKILERWPNSKHFYTKGQQLLLKAVKQDRNATELDELDRYRLLLWAINVARQRDVRMKNFQPMLAPIEGNNRTGAHTYIWNQVSTSDW